jgi:hypothetical protein
VIRSYPREGRVRPAAIGLLVVLTFSLVAAWGRKPPKEDTVKVTLRPLSTSEVMAILREFPEMVPDYLASKKNDTTFLADVYGFIEVTAPVLKRVLPAARFYRAHDFTTARHPYLIAISKKRNHWMPEGFNRLLSDNGMKVSDGNTLALAQALTILTVEGEYGSVPQITFRDAQRIDTAIGGITRNARLNVESGERVELWHFARWHDGFGVVSRGTEEGKLIKQYDLLQVEPSPKR